MFAKRSTVSKTSNSLSQNKITIPKSKLETRQSQNVPIQFSADDFPDEDIQAALELNHDDFSDDEHILASIIRAVVLYDLLTGRFLARLSDFTAY